MLRSIKNLTRYSIQATDGSIGHVHDFYFDDYQWRVRYLVADTSSWLPGRRVLLSTMTLGEPAWDRKQFPVRLTREQVKKSPESGSHPPVSRQHEIDLHSYYAWPLYWGAWDVAGPAGIGIEPSTRPVEGQDTLPEAPRPRPEDAHLQSANDLMGYSVVARDGSAGHVENIVLEDENWEIRFLIVDTSNWPGGKSVLISPEFVRNIESLEGAVHVSLTSEGVRGSPEFRSMEEISNGLNRGAGDNNRRAS